MFAIQLVVTLGRLVFIAYALCFFSNQLQGIFPPLVKIGQYASNTHFLWVSTAAVLVVGAYDLLFHRHLD